MIVVENGVQSVAYEQKPFTEYLRTRASYHELTDVHKAARTALLQRYSYKKRRRPLYGNLPKYFTTEQLRVFFSDPVLQRNHSMCIVFLRQLFYGLRVSEVCSVAVVPGQAIVRIWSEKMDRWEYLPLIPGTEFLFAVELFYSVAYIAKYFREIVDRQGLKFVYDHATNGRPLTQFSNHTLRHTAGNLLFKHTSVEYKMHVFLRHETGRLYGATASYLHYDFEDMRGDMVASFSPFIPL